MSLTATPPTLAFSDLERGQDHQAMTLQLHSFNAEDAVELRMHCTNPRLTVEALPHQPGAVRVTLLCSEAGAVQGTIVCTSPAGSITVPISAVVLEPAKYQALRSSTPARAQPQPSGFVERLCADERPSGSMLTDADAQRCRPVVHVRALRIDDAAMRGSTRRRTLSLGGSGVPLGVPLVWAEPDPMATAADPTDPTDLAAVSISEREHRAIAQAQVSEGAVRQQRESRETAGAQRSLLELVRQVSTARNALERAEQERVIPDGAAAPCRALQAPGPTSNQPALHVVPPYM